MYGIGEEEQQRSRAVGPATRRAEGIWADLFVARRRRCHNIASSSLRDLGSKFPPQMICYSWDRTLGSLPTLPQSHHPLRDLRSLRSPHPHAASPDRARRNLPLQIQSLPRPRNHLVIAYWRQGLGASLAWGVLLSIKDMSSSTCSWRPREP